MTNLQTIHASELINLDLNNNIILDVRTYAEHTEKHLQLKHIHIPLDQLDSNDFVTKYNLDQNSNVYILCHIGKRAFIAALKFNFKNSPNVYVIEGGIIACENLGYAIGIPDKI